MNSKEIKEIKNLMFDNKEWKNINSSARKLYEEICINACSKYYHRPYAEEYIDILGYDRVMEIYNDQKNYFDTKCRVEKNVYTDCEGITYNSLIEEE